MTYSSHPTPSQPVTPPAIPRGVADFFGGAALARRQAETKLRELTRLWAYSEIIPPTFEYADTLASEAGSQLAEELYRFLDRDGRTLALRPDLTIPTARIAGSKLYDQPLPQRFFYAGPAFRYEEPREGRQREFWQAGIELIGASSPDADAEILALAVRALQTLGLDTFRFSLGHLGYFHGLLEQLQLTGPQTALVQAALDRKNRDELADLVADLHLSSPNRASLTGLLDLIGGLESDTLVRAEALARNQKMADAIQRLQALSQRLRQYEVADAFMIDLADVRGMDYYTGITFKAYTTQMGSSIVNGGRYDNLIGHFGPARPAVGCAFYLDRILLAQRRQLGPPPEPQLDLLIYPCNCGRHIALAQQSRRAGLRTALALGSESLLLAPVSLRCTCDGFATLIRDDQSSQSFPAQTWPQVIKELWPS
ncbi:MAG: ATP phosphoribosyltransferase regulatory subunit [Chloroflexi bacterium]|nr:ATP phosphoribosyltransferase regulatory subunit [Chloroflexota bacterium]